MYDSCFGWRFINPKMQEIYGTDGMGVTAENLVEKHNISREDQDAFAYHSQMKAAKAQKNGRLAKEIVPLKFRSEKKTLLFLQKTNLFAQIRRKRFCKITTSLQKRGRKRNRWKRFGFK